MEKEIKKLPWLCRIGLHRKGPKIPNSRYNAAHRVCKRCGAKIY